MLKEIFYTDLRYHNINRLLNTIIQSVNWKKQDNNISISLPQIYINLLFLSTIFKLITICHPLKTNFSPPLPSKKSNIAFKYRRIQGRNCIYQQNNNLAKMNVNYIKELPLNSMNSNF